MLNKAVVSLLATTSLIGTMAIALSITSVVAQEPTLLAQQSTPKANFTKVEGFNGVVSSVAIAPDGKTLLVGSAVDGITAVDTASLQKVYTIPIAANPFSEIVISPNGSFFAAADGNVINLFSTDGGSKQRTLQGHQGKISDIAISPDNKTIVSVSGEDRTIRVWDAEQGTLRETIGEGVGPVITVNFSPDGKMFVTGSIADFRQIKFWDTETLKLLKTSPQQPGFIYTVMVTPTGKRLVAGVRNFFRGWDLMETSQGLEMKEVFSVRGPALDFTMLALSPDGRLAASGDKSGNVMLFDVATGKALTTLRGHRGWVLSVAFSPDSKLLYSGAEDGTVRVWDLSQIKL
jgi:WD40 repeat protein